MSYPTIEEVERASHMQLAAWHRFLHSPGWTAIGRANHDFIMEREAMILNRIEARFVELGGMTPEISKAISWERG